MDFGFWILDFGFWILDFGRDVPVERLLSLLLQYFRFFYLGHIFNGSDFLVRFTRENRDRDEINQHQKQ
ncbi:MAG: hypothetical protein HC785_24830 [Calothrix sp. CSU_2_0]|nr:hypothetical protein [Calothrix sp. CSU_2_0]